MPSYPCCARSCLGRDILSENEGENGKVISAYIQVASPTFFLQQSILKTQLSSPKGLVDEVRRGDSLVLPANFIKSAELHKTSWLKGIWRPDWHLAIVCLIALMLLPADTPNVSFFSFLEGFGYNDNCCKKYV